MIYRRRWRSGLDLLFQVERNLGVIREQEVVKDEEGPAQGPTRNFDKLFRRHDPWIIFPKEASKVVYPGNQSVCERVRREQDRPRFFVGDGECGNNRDDSIPYALGLDTRTKM